MADKEVRGVVIRLDIPPSSHPGTIVGATPGATLGRSALEGIYVAYGKINDLAGQVRSKELLAVSAQPFAERAIRSAGSTLNKLAAQRDHMDGEIAKDITAEKNSPQAAEVRAHWRGQKSPILKLSEIFQTDEILTISAVLSAPAYLSGLSEKHQGELRKLAATILVPEKVNARKETDAAIQHVERATDNFAKTMAANLNEWRDRDAELIEETLK